MRVFGGVLAASVSWAKIIPQIACKCPHQHEAASAAVSADEQSTIVRFILYHAYALGRRINSARAPASLLQLVDCVKLPVWGLRRYKAHFRWEHLGSKAVDTSSLQNETDPCASVTAAFLKARYLPSFRLPRLRSSRILAAAMSAQHKRVHA